MKKLSKLRLNVLNEQGLEEKQMNALRGGNNCYCSCYWANQGGSSIEANRDANYIIKVILFILLCSYKINAQVILIPISRHVSNMTTVDSGNIRIWYALNATDINNSETYDDYQRLEIGVYLSRYYSYFIYYSDSLHKVMREEHSNVQGRSVWMGVHGKNEFWSEYQFSEYYKDFSKNVFTEYAVMPMYMHRYNCHYSEDIPIQNWKLQNDTLTVVDYLCQKATCRFRGRDYTAWFTVDIPISNGPWKFGGLPGLILKVYDNEKRYIFECTRVEIHEKKYPITLFDYKHYEKIDRKKLLQFQKAIHDDYFKVAGVEFTSIGKQPEKIPYNPLELE
ncbi:MAG: GLPGLI family protein [Fusobacteriaceae bacterium]|jgi:GLPGLI family protein|nr:GLPGLI family protein [Fusobacteriaceae bacterium]